MWHLLPGHFYKMYVKSFFQNTPSGIIVFCLYHSLKVMFALLSVVLVFGTGCYNHFQFWEYTLKA